MAKAREAEARAKRDAEIAAKEKAQREAREAEEKMRREAEAVVKAREAETKARRDAERGARGAEEKVRREAEAVDKAKAVKAEAKREAKPAAGAGLYKDTVKLAIMPPIDLGQVKQLEERLRQVENLQVVLVSGSLAEDCMIVVSVEKSIPLVDVLKAMPVVERVVASNKKIIVQLKSPTTG